MASKKRSKGSKASTGKRKRRISGTDDEEPASTGKRKRRISGTDDEPAFFSSKYAEPPTSKIYNSNFSRKGPAELFRKDLISAMKLPDSEPLTPDDYWLIDDSWKPEWERGVQIPIYPDALPEPQVKILRKKSKKTNFRLPNKLFRFTRDTFSNPDVHVMTYNSTLAERTCRYDMDDVDHHWLNKVNEDRKDYGLYPLKESFVEQMFEEFEVQCYANFQEAIESEEGLGVKYDEDAICDVCRSAFCKKHSRKLRGCFSDSGEDDPSFKISKEETLTSEERANIRQQKIQSKQAEFYNYVNIDAVADIVDCDKMEIEIIYNYWKLKRRGNRNRALLPPKIDNNNCVEGGNIASLKKLVHLRQDLERARNLCYMTMKREKIAKKWIPCKHIFAKQVEILSNKSSECTEQEMRAILDANLGDIAYDKKHTEMNGPSPNVVNVLTSLVGEDYVKGLHLNGAVKGGRKSDRMKSERTPNPYAKHYLNGLVKRSQRWFDDKQKKVSNLQSCLEVKANTNTSFQSSSDHLLSDDGFDSSKDVHDLNIDSKFMSQVEPKFECFNASDNVFVNLETYHSSDSLMKEENSTEDSDKRIAICFPEINTFSLSSNDSTFASPPKHLYESLDESMSETEVKIKVKSTNDANCNDESKSCSGLEKQNFAKKELLSFKQKNKVSCKSRKRSKRSVDERINSSIINSCGSINSSEDASNLSNCEPVVESSSDELENVKLCLELPIENCIDVENVDKLTTVEIAETVVPNEKSKCEKTPTASDDKKLSTIQCVLAKSEVPPVSAKSESASGKARSAKVIEICDRPIKTEASDLSQFEECSKIINDKSVSNLAKDIKIRPSSNKESPLRTQSPTFKSTENGLVKGSKSNSKQNAEKSQILSKLHLSKSKNVNNSHPVSSPVNKQPPSSSIFKCQDKTSSAVSKSDESELSEVKDSCIEAPAAAPVPRKDMLRGYKIPKKPRSEKPEENSLDLKRGNTPLSPLPNITSSSLSSGYDTKGNHSWRKLEPRAKGISSKPRTNMNGNIQRQSSERLVLKLKKDTSDPESQRWKTDPNNFNRNMSGWIGEFPLYPWLLPPPPPPPPPPYLSHHPPRQWPRVRNRGGFRSLHMSYGNGPYT